MGSSSRQERAAPEYGYGMNIHEPFAMPSSGLRWSGLALAHARRRDDPPTSKKDKTKSGEDGVSSGQTTLVIIFVLGGTLMVLLMVAFFIFAW